MSAPSVVTDIALVTASEMPREDEESMLVVEALAALGLTAVRCPWDAPMDWARIPLVVCRTPWDYFHRRVEFLSWAAGVAAVTRIENPIDVVTWNSHKSYLLALEAAGVAVVPTTLVTRGAGETIQAAALACYDSVVVIKPAVSAGAFETLRTDAGSITARDHLRRLAGDGDVLVQPFMPSVGQDGETSLVYFDGRYSHAVRKLPADGDYRVQAHLGGSVHEHVAGAEEMAMAEAALEVCPSPTAYARVDLVTGADGPMVMELEVIEPELFLPRAQGSADRLAATLASRYSLPFAGRLRMAP